MEIENEKVYEAKFVTRLEIRKRVPEQEAYKFLKKYSNWSKEKIEEEIKRIYESSLEQLEKEDAIAENSLF